MGNQKITGLAAGALPGDAARYDELTAVSGVANAAAVKSSNLSDLTSASTARTNLGLGTAATTAATAYATSAQGTAADNALPKAGGTMTGNIAMGGSHTVTGLAAADANGEAVRFEQLPVGGQASVTTDASGYANITHGMGTTPSWAVVTWESSGSARDYYANVVSRTSSVIQVRVYGTGVSGGTATVDNTAVKLNWIAR